MLLDSRERRLFKEADLSLGYSSILFCMIKDAYRLLGKG